MRKLLNLLLKPIKLLLRGIKALLHIFAKLLIPILVWMLLTLLVAEYVLKPQAPRLPPPPRAPTQQEVLETLRTRAPMKIQLMYLLLVKASGHQRDLNGVYVIPDPRWNAFVTNRNEIYFLSGMLAEIKNDHEIAYILAHEISHVMLGHTRKDRVPEDSRFSEFHSDMMALVLMQKAGFDPCKASGLWARMAKRSGSQIVTSSHPDPVQRAHYTKLPQCEAKK